MNYRIMARSTTIIQRRRRKQADGKAHTKNGKDGGSDYGLQAWDETFVRNKASSPLQREQVAGCIRAPTAAIIIGQRETIAEPTTTMRTRKRMLRPRKGRHRRRCTKSIKKAHPTESGALSKVWKERERKFSSLDIELVAKLPRTHRQSDLFLPASSFVWIVQKVREDRLPKEDYGIYHGHQIRLAPEGRIDLARKRLKFAFGRAQLEPR